jgi:hypothetical protein
MEREEKSFLKKKEKSMKRQTDRATKVSADYGIILG